MLRSRQWLILLALLLLIGLAVSGLVFTSRSTSRPTAQSRTPAKSAQPMVDMRSLQTARQLAPLAASPDEQRLAQDALRLADHDVDLAFAAALREAADAPTETNPELQPLHDRMEQADAKAKSAQDRVTTLEKRLEAAGQPEKETLNNQLQLAKAELELDLDELSDSKEDLLRAGGNPQGKIQQLLDEHEAAQHTPIQSAVSSNNNGNPNSFWMLAQSWNASRNLRNQLDEAISEAQQTNKNLSAEHDALEQKVRAEESRRQATKNVATGLTSESAAAHDDTSRLVAAAAIASLKHFTNDQKRLSTLDKRIQNLHELSDVYNNWSSSAHSRSRTALNGMIRDILWVLVIFLIVYIVSLLMDRLFTDLTPDRKRLITLRSVLRFAVQALGVLFAIFVMFGVPSQTPTIIGLAGAGLTVALKDFIVGFVGWFVLMGKNGLRVGDWVEINGVVGEVIEIGLLRTVLLETGNWTDSGHPTGRKVAFVNSFAIEGHFFNFSTSGQWLWDEVQLMIPAGRDPHTVITAVQKLVIAETETDARLAEHEFQRAASHNRVRSFSAEPAINVRPTSSGIELHVRYITRAHERYAMRTRLYEKMVDLLHGSEAALKS